MSLARFSLTPLLALQLALFFIASCAADLVTYDWRVTYITAAYDGVAVETIGINDAPSDQAIIDVELGQEVEVRLTNELSESTCLHWHGLRELGTQEMDGVSGITQCYIPPGSSVVYRFTPDKAGTFWWHSHHGTQYAFGLRGPLIVHAPTSELQEWEEDIDEEFVVQLAEVYHEEPGVVPMWDSIVINNLGRYNCSAAASHGLTDCTDDQPLSRFLFEAGKKYLLRVANMAALAPMEFSIDDHEFQVIAADAEPLEPSELINTVMLNAGQRMDLLVEAKNATSTTNTTIGSFWMRATSLYGLPWTAGTASTAGDGFNDEGLAIVYYEAEDETEPTTQVANETKTIGEFEFTPLVPVSLPSTTSDRPILEFDFRRGLGYFSIDGGNYTNFAVPEVPPLFSIADGLTTEELPTTANARAIEYGKHVEVVLVNDMNEQHPFHLHAHTPWVVGSGQASLEDIQNNELSLKLEGAMKRDTYTVPPCTTDDDNACLDVGYLVLRFTAEDPGVWIFHCHIDWHLDAGLAMILVEGEEELQKLGADSFSTSMLSVCGSGYTNYDASNSTTA